MEEQTRMSVLPGDIIFFAHLLKVVDIHIFKNLPTQSPILTK